jgi:hypothetical protein
LSTFKGCQLTLNFKETNLYHVVYELHFIKKDTLGKRQGEKCPFAFAYSAHTRLLLTGDEFLGQT